MGDDGHILHTSQQTAGGSWGDWSDLGRESVEPGFVVGQYKDGRLAIFGVRTHSSNGLRQSDKRREAREVWSVLQQTPGGPYGGLKAISGTNLGMTAIRQIAVGTAEDGRVQLFGINEEKGVWTSQESGAAGKWTAWTQLEKKHMDFYPQ